MTMQLLLAYQQSALSQLLPMMTKIAAAALSSLLILTAGVEGASIQQTAEVWTTGAYTGVPESPISGSKAVLTRTDAGLGLHLQTTGLKPGTFTLWWLIYNDPSKCENASGAPSMCDGADMLNPEVSSVLRAGGDIVDESGSLTMVSWLPVGSDLPYPGNVMGSLTNPESAEVHNLLVWHGLPLPLGDGTDLSSLEAQIHDLQGGCEYYRVNGGMEPPPLNITLMGGPFELCPMLQGTYFAVPEGEMDDGDMEEGDDEKDEGEMGDGDMEDKDPSAGGDGRVLMAIGGLFSAFLRHGLYL